MSQKLNNEQRKFAEDNHNLIYSFANSKSLPLDDYYDLLAIAYCNAVLTFDEDKGSFASYAYSVMMNELHNEWRKMNSKKRKCNSLVSLDAVFNMPSSESVEDIAVANADMESILENENAQLRKLLELRMKKLSQKEIGEKLGISQAQVSRLMNKAKGGLENIGKVE